MKSAWYLCAIVFLATALAAQTSTTAKPKRSSAITAADVQALRDAIAAQQQMLQQQQQQIQQLSDELHRKDQAVQQAQTTATDAVGKADAAQTAASQQQESVAALKSDVSDLKLNMTNTVMTLQETQKNSSESPMALHFRGITVSPGGFLAAETVWRSRALGADVNTPFNNITMPGASQSNMAEFFGSGRQSRVAMLAETNVKSAKLSGYVEADFLSSGTTSNNNQSNSYSLRQRQAWGQAAFDNGWTVTGGQMWSLLTETKKGMENRPGGEALPLTIDAQYTVGFSWARQYGFRVTKNIANKVWFGVSVENAQATLSSHSNASNFLVGAAGASGGLYNQAISTCSTTNDPTTGLPVTTCSPLANYAFNPSPDIIAKLAFEPGFGHYEIFGVYSRFRDRVFPCAEASTAFPCGTITTPSASGAYDASKNGGGFGASARWSVLNKRLLLGVHGFGGSGVGRYGSGGLADASVHANGTLKLIRSLQGLATVEWHGPRLDIYLNAGAEYAGRAADFDPISGKVVGYGAPTFKNSGCFTETIPQNGAGFLPGSLSGCTADTRFLAEGTAGFWFRIYDGSKEKEKSHNYGILQWGPQFSYVDRQAWSGASGIEPHGLDAMVFTSFRYYLPQ